MSRSPLSLPRNIGGHRVLERIAPGVPEVFKVLHRSGEPTVCLKRIPAAAIDDDVDFVARFEDEARLAMQLRHPNIVEVFEFGEDDGYYLVMEHVDGADLATLLERVDTLDPVLVAYIGAEISRALSFIHHSDPAASRGPLIHFDVSPQNILVGRDGAVKLSDFGLARALGKTGAEVLTARRGKARFLSPEQWRDEPVSSRSDLFSLGLVLWGALIGTHPYAEGRPRGRGLDEWIHERTIANARRSTVEAAPSAPAALQNAIDGLLQPVERRIATAEALFRMLAPLAPTDSTARLAATVAG